jgi:hypothetical protein
MAEEGACNERLEAPPPLRLSLDVLTRPKVLLRIEGGLDLVLSLVFYQYLHANWILFVVLLLAPDLAILGYVGGIRLGTICYNLIHTLAGPFLLMMLLPDRINVAIAVRLDLDLSYRSGPDAWLWTEVSNRVRRHTPEE